MFTGLVEATGRIFRRSGKQLEIALEKELPKPVYGESIAVNGCCLTLERCIGKTAVFHTMEETLARTNLGRLPIGAAVNLERALRVGDRLGGHMVTGHIDGVGKLIAIRERGSDVSVQIAYPAELRRGLVEKGSIAVDGISLTVAELDEDTFTVCLIPVTMAETALCCREPGDAINLETDLFGKYVARLTDLRAREESGSRGTVTMEKLREAGFL